MTPEEWIIGGDTGVSSKTIWAVMMGVVPDNPAPFTFSVPLDPSDFGRCFRLLEQIPEWRDRLNEVAETFPEWGPMVREWAKMTHLYRRSIELYDLMQDLKHEGMRNTGWVEVGPGSWKKDK